MKLSKVFYFSSSWSSFSSNVKFSFIICYLVLISFYNPTNSGAVDLDESNLEKFLVSTELIFINFYADWCRFSNMLQPIFDEAAEKVRQEFPDENRVILGKVDCDKHSSISSRYKISKYPTLKLIRNGISLKKEYRGARTPDAFLEFIKKQLESPIQEYKSLQELIKIETDKRIFVGHLNDNSSKTFNTYRRVAMNLKDECSFYVGFGEASRTLHPPNVDIITFRPDKSRSVENDETFTGNTESFDELLAWVQAKCVPLVREITFENAEELTEEGLPFLILFHTPDDTENIKKFNALVQNHLMEEKQSMNFLTADGNRFAHPLHHLGKSAKDLPLIAIDSFRHMYLYPNANDMEDNPDKIKKYLSDLHTGKLHREFHYGPDPTAEEPNPPEKSPTIPPESTFRKLLPSKNRYTLLRDEL